MFTLASLLLFATLSVRPDAGLRISNPHATPAEATLTCGEAREILTIEPGAFVDVPDGARCASVESLSPLTTLETLGNDMQRAIGEDAECGDTVVFAPLFACQNGTGAAGVPFTDGATYSWSIEGGAIMDGAGTPRVTLAFGQPGNVKLTCVVTTKECSRIASAVIAVREPIAITQLTLPQTATTDEPVTVTWTYGATSPTSQLLSGDALEAPVSLPGSARSYTFTPKLTGSRTIELRASYYAALHNGPAKSKRRAAGRGAASASDCATVTASRALDVKGCTTFVPSINAPSSVDAGSTFEARVNLEDGEEAEWTVENATLVDSNARTGRAVIRAGETGEVKMNVRVMRGACTRASSAKANVIPAAKQCPVSPTATLTHVRQGCAVVVKAAFTGAPPFRGTWSDGESFNTTKSSLEHTFDEPGTYGITGFRDATCIGSVSGAPRVDELRGSVRLEAVGGACTNGKLVAKFSGTPPFTFKWTNGWPVNEWVTTNDREVVRELESDPEHIGDWKIEGMFDAVCSQQAMSNVVRIKTPPAVEVLPGPFCQYDEVNTPRLVARFSNASAPLTIRWNDGVVSTSNDPSLYVYRTVPKPAEPIVEYSIESAMSNGCFAEIGNRSTYVSYRPTPRIDTDDIDIVTCPGETGTLTLKKLPPPEAEIAWTVPGGEIVSGQGTPTITYRGTNVQDSLIRVDAVYPDGSCSTFDHVMVRFHGISDATDFKATPATIGPGQSTVLSFRIDRNINSFGINVTPFARNGDLGLTTCTDGLCRATFKDTAGAGTVTFELQYFGDCMPHYKSLFTTLTIQE